MVQSGCFQLMKACLYDLSYHCVTWHGFRDKRDEKERCAKNLVSVASVVCCCERSLIDASLTATLILAHIVTKRAWKEKDVVVCNNRNTEVILAVHASPGLLFCSSFASRPLDTSTPRAPAVPCLTAPSGMVENAVENRVGCVRVWWGDGQSTLPSYSFFNRFLVGILSPRRDCCIFFFFFFCNFCGLESLRHGKISKVVIYFIFSCNPHHCVLQLCSNAKRTFTSLGGTKKFA